jgi:geranylgeranyl pyrophosphate synthase
LKTDELAKLLGILNLPDYMLQVEQNLEAILSVSDSKYLREPSLRLVKNGGKRLRPFLVIAAALSQGGRINQKIIQASASLELVHMGTIVHDDIIDKADLRWGIPTINKQEGVDHAILVGDYLLALATVRAMDVSRDIGYIIASTVAVMCEGQSQETADEYNINRTIESYIMTIKKKTAALTSAACRIGAECAGMSKAQVESLSLYGEEFGIAFQIIDDLLDFLSTSEAMGKPVGNDMKEGIYTLPLLFGLEEPTKERLRVKLKNSNQIQHKDVVDILKKSGAFEKTIYEIQCHNKAAGKALEKREKNGVIVGLSKLPDVYLKWALQKQSIL